MEETSMSAQSVVRSAARQRMHGPVLIVARIVWIATALMVISVCIVGFPATFQHLKTICSAGIEVCYGSQLTPAASEDLQAMGIPITFYAWYILAFEILFVLAWFAVALLIFWRKSNERLAWFASYALLTFGATYTSVTANYIGQNIVWWWIENFVALLGNCSLVLLLYVFPDGFFVPRWIRLLIFGWLLWNLQFLFHNQSIYATTLSAIFDFSMLALGIGAQIYRYARVSTPIQQQQTKWAVFGFVMALSGFLVLALSGRLLPPSFIEGAMTQLIVQPAYYLLVMFIPIFIGIAISGSLALIYVGLILGLQFLMHELIQQTNDVAFSDVLRTQVDLDQLGEHLLAVVQEGDDATRACFAMAGKAE